MMVMVVTVSVVVRCFPVGQKGLRLRFVRVHEDQIAEQLISALVPANLVHFHITVTVIVLVEVIKLFIVLVQPLQVLVPLAGPQAEGHVQVGSSAVGEAPLWFAQRRLVGLGQIEIVGLRVHYEALFVLVIDSVGRIVLRERSDRGPNELDPDGLVWPGQRINNSPLVAVSVPIELGHDRVTEAVDDVDEVK